MNLSEFLRQAKYFRTFTPGVTASAPLNISNVVVTMNWAVFGKMVVAFFFVRFDISPAGVGTLSFTSLPVPISASAYALVGAHAGGTGAITPRPVYSKKLVSASNVEISRADSSLFAVDTNQQMYGAIFYQSGEVP